MNKTKALSTIIEKYLNGKCTLSELKTFLGIISDPGYALLLKPVLSLYWESNTANNSNKLTSVENQEKILDKIHHRINLHILKLYMN